MTSIAEEIQATKKELQGLDRDFRQKLAALHDETQTKTLDLVAAFQDRRVYLSDRLAKLEGVRPLVTPAGGRVLSAETSSPAAKAKTKSAGDIILHLLSEATEPLHGSRLDDAVVKAGLTKAAAEKAKYNLKKKGLIAANKLHWSITEAGRAEIKGARGKG
jgi:hypothetical protein